MIEKMTIVIDKVTYIEKWKDIDGYIGLYKISSLGRIISFHKSKMALIKPTINKTGYPSVVLYKKKKFKSFLVHRLVAAAFIKNKYNKPYINHKDCNPNNPHVYNLEWCTHKENMEYAKKLGRLMGNKYGMLLNQKAVKPVIAFKNGVKLGVYPSMKIAGESLGIRQGNISDCCTGKLKTTFGYSFSYAI